MSEKTWTQVGDDYTLAYCEGDDPRIVAITLREEYVDDNPTEWCGEHAIIRHDWSWRGLTARGCQCGDCADSWGAKVTEAFIRALDEFGDIEWAERYLRIFWDAEVEVLGSHIDRYSNIIIFVKSDGTVSADRETMQAWLDGEVYGIGYAVNLDRADHTEAVDLTEWEVTMDSWGYFGEDYAKEMALPLADKEQADASAALNADLARRELDEIRNLLEPVGAAREAIIGLVVDRVTSEATEADSAGDLIAKGIRAYLAVGC